jgi:hypothetical protein
MDDIDLWELSDGLWRFFEATYIKCRQRRFDITNKPSSVIGKGDAAKIEAPKLTALVRRYIA